MAILNKIAIHPTNFKMDRDFELVNGVYKGPKHYPGSLYLVGTPITDLGSLKSVGGYLDLGGTSVYDLGSLESVGGSIYTDDSKHYSFQYLKILIQKIEDSSIVTLVERLLIEKDPFLKRVIERRIRGV